MKKLLLLSLLTVCALPACVSTPKGSKFDPWEAMKRADQGISDYFEDDFNRGMGRRPKDPQNLPPPAPQAPPTLE